MPTRDSPVVRATRIAAEDERRVLVAIAEARRAAGLSDADVGRACRMSRWAVARTLGGARTASVIEIAALGSAVGLGVRLQAYPGGDPIRDAPQQRLLDRLRRMLHPSIAWRTEVILPGDRDQRAWDAVIRRDAWWVAVEAETVVSDVQALERRLNRKIRDGGATRVILLIADTRRNREAIAAAPAAFSGFERRPRRVLAPLRRGADPGISAIVLL